MRTIIIGDIHGCADEFEELLEVIAYQREQDRLLLTGDAFARGPDPLGTWYLIQESQAEMVLGNHDDKLINRLHCKLNDKPIPIKKPDQQITLDLLDEATRPLFDWLGTVPLYILDPEFLLVHAGINPVDGLEATTRSEFTSIRTWPPAGGINGPRWHDVLIPDHQVVVFGHDAPGGLVVKRRGDGAPYAVGLDTGCVYGGQLTAYIVEEQKFVHVKSKGPYFP
jgi:hypothetical protein